MKKKFLSILLLCTTLLLSNNTFVFAQAQEDSSSKWIMEELSDYEPYQELLKEYLDIEILNSTTKYILNEIVSDQDGNIIKTTEKNFDNIKSMNNYQKLRELENKNSDAGLLTINPGETKYNNSYTQIRVGINLMKLTSDYYFIAFVYDWLTPPPETLLDYTRGAVALCISDNMHVNRDSYGGRITSTLYSGAYDTKTISNGLLLNDENINAIGYAFNLPYAAADMSGVISFCANKSGPDNNYASAYGEFSSINRALSLDDFSVSFPWGISININTARTKYTFADSLYLN